MKKVCIAVAMSTVLVMLLDRLAGMSWLLEALVLSRQGTGQLGTPIAWLWQIFTHAFVYPPQGLAFAVVGLLFFWLMGAPFEIRFGSRTLLKLLVVSVLASGFGAIVAMVVPGPLGNGVVMGVSPMLVGLITGIAASSPLHSKVSLFGVFNMTQRTLLISLAVAIVLFGIANGNYLEIVAEFSAGAAAYVYIKTLLNAGRRGPKKKKQKPKRPPRTFTVIEGGAGSGDDDEDIPKWLN